jgi:hypothetical protein
VQLPGNSITKANNTMKKWKKKDTTDINLRVREAQVKQLYRQTWIGLTGVFVITISVCAVLWQVIPQWKLSLWAGSSFLLIIVRGLLIAAFQRKKPSGPDIHQWARLHVIGVVLSGILWAMPALFLWPSNSPAHQLIWLTCIVGLSASAVAMYYTWTPSYMSFLILTLVPISLRLLFDEGMVYVILGLLGLFFTGVLAQTGKVMHAVSLRTLIVGMHNEALSAILTEEKAKEAELNAKLHQEIAERKHSQEELGLRNQELERLNTQLTATKKNLESTNKELEDALNNVKQLSNMLPICSSCKKIRNDEGYWEQIETYIWEHADVQFSHGVCPECAKKIYPNYKL